jgi:hypothetical protein
VLRQTSPWKSISHSPDGPLVILWFKPSTQIDYSFHDAYHYVFWDCGTRQLHFTWPSSFEPVITQLKVMDCIVNLVLFAKGTICKDYISRMELHCRASINDDEKLEKRMSSIYRQASNWQGAVSKGYDLTRTVADWPPMESSVMSETPCEELGIVIKFRVVKATFPIIVAAEFEKTSI